MPDLPGDVCQKDDEISTEKWIELLSFVSSFLKHLYPKYTVRGESQHSLSKASSQLHCESLLYFLPMLLSGTGRLLMPI